MKRSAFISMFFLILTACRNEVPKNPDGSPRVANDKEVKLGTDEYDQNSVRDTVAAERGTTNKDSTTGLGGNRHGAK